MNTVTEKPYLYISTDKLQTWQLIDTLHEVSDIVIDSQKLLLNAIIWSGSNPSKKLYRSMDAGQNWAYLDSVDFQFQLIDGNMYSLNSRFKEILKDTVIGFSGTHYIKSADFGLTWDSTQFDIPFWNVAPIYVSDGTFLTDLGMYSQAGVIRYVPKIDSFYSTVSGMNARFINYLAAYHNKLYAGGRQFFMSDDAGTSWYVPPFLNPNEEHFIRDFDFQGDK